MNKINTRASAVNPMQKGNTMYKVVFEYKDGRKGTCKANGKHRLFDTQSEAEEFASDLNEITKDMRDALPFYRVEECEGEEPAKPKINVKERISIVRAMETIARAINHEGIFEEWLSCGVADGDIDETTTDDELMYYVEENETFGELMATHLAKVRPKLPMLHHVLQ